MELSVAFILNFYPLYGQAQTNEEQYAVFCYVGDPKLGDHVYSFDTYHPLEATELCNATHIGCHGKCIGCYLKAGKEICMGQSGRHFNK